MSDFRPQQTPVRNQGDRPTCVAFATSAAHEWSAGDAAHRSAEDAMWAAHRIGGVPGREEVAASWALTGPQTHGHASETAWPYGQPRWTAGRPDAALAREPPRPDRLHHLANAGFDSVAAAVDAARPVILTLGVVYTAWREPGGVIDAEPGRKALANHAVLAVGALTGPDRIVLKNSWGPNWGDHGYGYVTRRYLVHYALRAHAMEGP